MKALLIALAAVQIVIGALLWLAPGFFFEQIGPYGPRNDHYNHLLDVGEADPSWLGPANLASLLLGTALLVWMLREASR